MALISKDWSFVLRANSKVCLSNLIAFCNSPRFDKAMLMLFSNEPSASPIPADRTISKPFSSHSISSCHKLVGLVTVQKRVDIPKVALHHHLLPQISRHVGFGTTPNRTRTNRWGYLGYTLDSTWHATYVLSFSILLLGAAGLVG